MARATDNGAYVNLPETVAEFGQDSTCFGHGRIDLCDMSQVEAESCLWQFIEESPQFVSGSPYSFSLVHVLDVGQAS